MNRKSLPMAFGAIWQSDIEGKYLFIDATDLSQTQATQTGFEGDILKNPSIFLQNQKI